MNVLLVSGLGPEVKYQDIFAGTVLSLSDEGPRERLRGAEILNWQYSNDGQRYPLLRRKTSALSCLTTTLLENLFSRAGCRVFHQPLEDVWTGLPPDEEFLNADFIALSTTFICNFNTLQTATTWIKRHFGDKTLILGGQFSNLKAAEILRMEPSVDCVIRGDGEVAISALVKYLAGEEDLAKVPNVVMRDPRSEAIWTSPLTYCDLNADLAIKFPVGTSVAPYESMRGCPFSCGFCSFPAASPKWRYKSVERMMTDFADYADSGIHHVRAMDSTFSIPTQRFRSFMRAKVSLPISWECYSRANAINSHVIVRELEDANCTALSIGLESMNDRTLRLMNKQVSTKHNRGAVEALGDSQIATRCSLMIGYPGETPDDFRQTYDYLTTEFPLRFMISVFSPIDETMPVWETASAHRLRIHEDVDFAPRWEHCGMNSDDAAGLLLQTLRDARWKNETGTHQLWQANWQLPLFPFKSRQDNQRIEKLIERYVFAEIDFDDTVTIEKRRWAIRSELQDIGILTETKAS